MFHKVKPDLFNVWMLEFFVALLDSGVLLKTGEKFGLSAAGSSRALDKLRAAFGDTLFSATNKGLTPTAYALSLRPKVLEAIVSMQTMHGDKAFDPQCCTRTFHVAGRGYAMAEILTDIIPVMHREAPLASVELHYRSRRFAQELYEREIDVALVPDKLVPEQMRYMPLFSMKRCLLLRKKHPLAILCQQEERSPSHKEILSWPGVALRMGDDSNWRPSVDLSRPRSEGETKVVYYANELSFALPLLASSDFVCVCPREAAEFAAKSYPLEVLPLPFEMTKEEQQGVLIWTELTQNDPSMMWFRSLFRRWADAKRSGCSLVEQVDS